MALPQVNVILLSLEQEVLPIAFLTLWLFRLVIIRAHLLHPVGDERLLELRERVKDERKVAHCDDRSQTFLIHVSGALIHALPDIEVC